MQLDSLSGILIFNIHKTNSMLLLISWFWQEQALIPHLPSIYNILFFSKLLWNDKIQSSLTTRRSLYKVSVQLKNITIANDFIFQNGCRYWRFFFNKFNRATNFVENLKAFLTHLMFSSDVLGRPHLPLSFIILWSCLKVNNYNLNNKFSNTILLDWKHTFLSCFCIIRPL